MTTTLAPTFASPRAAHAPAADPVWRRYGEYLRRPPLLVVEWHDRETPARGWLVINSLRGGAAGGGTRMRAGLTRQEVVYLAKTMELKFAFSGPAIGGAKSGLDFDSADPRRAAVLRRWFQAMAPLLRTCYGTGGDLNVDELADVIPGCAEAGLAHPQEGVARGHFQAEAARLGEILAALDEGVRAPVREGLGLAGTPLTVADLVTGYGVAQSIVHHYALHGQTVAGQRVRIEGFGAVGGPCALYLARAGACIVGLSDREKALVAPEGLGVAEVEALLRARREKLLPRGDARCLWGAEQERFWRTPADVFVAAAASGTLDEPVLEALRRQGVRVIACGANQPFHEAKLGATRVQRAADQQFVILPDVLANCGMARAFSFLMQEAIPEPTAIFQAVDATIRGTLAEVVARNEDRETGLMAASFGHALDLLSA